MLCRKLLRRISENPLTLNIIVAVGFSPLRLRSRVEIPIKPMDNKAIANIFYETADLMKVANEDGFRIRSYERAAEALEGWPQQVSTMAEKEVLEIPGIGKGMAANIRQLITTGKLSMHEEMLQEVSSRRCWSCSRFPGWDRRPSR